MDMEHLYSVHKLDVSGFDCSNLNPKHDFSALTLKLLWKFLAGIITDASS